MRFMNRIAGCGILACIALMGCGSGSIATTSSPTGNATFNLVVTDTPPTNVTVLSFQVQITGAVLQPGNVSVLPRPVTVDLAQLATDTSFLASTVIGSATYTSLTITLANPQVTLMNNTSGTLTAAGQSCIAGAICTFSLALNNASVTISSGVLPLSVTANSSTGLNLDLSIPDLLQSDLSITLANGSSVNLSLLPQPSSSTAQQVELDDIMGTITQVSTSQVSLTTVSGDSLVLTPSSSMKVLYPSSVCSSGTSACLAVGQVVSIDAGMLGSGALSLNAVSYIGASGTPAVKGLVLSTNTTAPTPSIQLLVQRQVNASSLTAGTIATVDLPLSSTAYAVGATSSPTVVGGVFSTPTDLMVGQELMVTAIGSPSSTFTASNLYLEDSQTIGRIAALNSASTSLMINGLSGLYSGSRPIVQQIGVSTDASTEYFGYSTASFSSLAAGQFISVRGPLFNTLLSQGQPSIAAVTIRSRSSGSW